MFFESETWKILCENVSSLFFCSNFDKLDCLSVNQVTDEMHLDLEMLVATRDTVIRSHADARCVVFKHHCCCALGEPNFSQKLA